MQNNSFPAWGSLLLAIAGILVGLGLGKCNRPDASTATVSRLKSQLSASEQKATLARALAATIPDTVFVTRIEYVPATAPQDAARPVVVQHQLTPDTLTRRKLEAAPIILGIKKAGPLLNIQTITPAGLVSQATFPAELTQINFRMDHAGNVAYDARELKRFRRRKFWQDAWQYTKGGIIGGVAVGGGLLIHKSLNKGVDD